MLRCLHTPLRLGALILLVSGLALSELRAQGNPMAEFIFGFSKAVNAVALSPDGRQAVSASQDNLLRLWDISTGLLLRTFDTQTGGTDSVAFSPDGRRILAGGNDARLRIWDVATGQGVAIDGHAGEVTSAAFVADGQQALSGSQGQDGQALGRGDRPDPQELRGAYRRRAFGGAVVRWQARAGGERGQDAQALGCRDGPTP